MKVRCCARRDPPYPRIRKVLHACVRCGAKDVGQTGVAGGACRRHLKKRLSGLCPRCTLEPGSTTLNGVDKRRVQREILWQTAEPLRAVGTIGPGAATPPRTGPHVSVMMMPARRRARAALTPHAKVGDLPAASPQTGKSRGTKPAPPVIRTGHLLPTVTPEHLPLNE